MRRYAKTFKYENYKLAVALLTLAAAFFAVVFRLRFGADITDEAFYFANARSIIEWGGPFITDVSASQMASALIIPFVWVYRNFVPDDSGIILALRYLYVAMTILTSICVFDFAKRRVSIPIAIILSIVPLVWMPFSLPACSYNTFVSNFLSMALLLIAAPLTVSSYRLSLASLLLFICVIAYPTLILPVALLYSTLYLVGFVEPKVEDNKRSVLTGAVAFASLCILSVIALIIGEGTEPFFNTFAMTRLLLIASSGSKMTFLLSQFSDPAFTFRLCLSAICGIFIFKVRSRWLQLSGALILLMTFIYIAYDRHSPIACASHEIMILLALSFMPAFTHRLWVKEQRVCIAFWISIIAAVITDLTSSNGLLNFAMGATPAVLIGLTYLCLKLRERSRLLAPVFVMSVVAIFVAEFTSSIYGEWNMTRNDLTYKMRSGAYKGLFTSQTRGKLLTALQADLAELSNPFKTMYVMGAPGFYLLSPLKEMDPFFYHLNDRQSFIPVMTRFFSISSHRPDLVLHVTSDPYFGKATTPDEALLSHGFRCSKLTPDYEIYVKTLSR